ncbi:MAG: succinate dehydrogenase assembly factor 2 [Rhodospirillaceae bacterium]
MNPDEPIDLRRKRLLYRATHRGTKEADVIIGGYFHERAAGLPETKLEEAEEFLEVSDLDLMDWLSGRKPIPERWKNTILDDILAWERNRQGV